MAGQAIDVLTATPLTSATSLAAILDRVAITLLDGFVTQGIAVEVTHPSAPRLFGLSGMAPVPEATRGPRRPVPGRGRSRLQTMPVLELVGAPRRPLQPPVGQFERPWVDYAAFEAATANCDRVNRDTWVSLSEPGTEKRNSR